MYGINVIYNQYEILDLHIGIVHKKNKYLFYKGSSALMVRFKYSLVLRRLIIFSKVMRWNF